MTMIKIGLIKERKTPPDTRVALTPAQCKQILEEHKDVNIVFEHSDTRCYSDEEYTDIGINKQDDLSDCDVLLGVKEVPIDYLIPNKTHFFFSHTKKMQPYNKPLMQALIAKNIKMVDYECLTFDNGQRVLGFGVHAGIVGAHNGLLTYGKKYGLFNLPAANAVKDFDAMIDSYKDIKLPAIKVVVTGSGRVPSGAMDVLDTVGVKQVSPDEFKSKQFEYPVYVLLKDETLYARKTDNGFDRQEFYTQPEKYKCLFTDYIPYTDLLINGIYWEETIDKLFQKEDVKRSDWNVKVISDITCDIDGSVPINVGATTIADPVYGISRETYGQTSAFQNTNDTIDIMAVDNLPNELPRDASKYFGDHFVQHVLPELLKEGSSMIKRGSICENGKLTKDYEYLSEYAYD